MNGSWFEGIAPKAGAFGVAGWLAAHYLIISPEITSRVLKADYLPACRSGFSESIKRQAEQVIQSLPRPRIDAARENAAQHVREMMRSGPGTILSGPLFGGVQSQVNGALAGYEQEKAEAQAAFRRAVDQINAATAVKIGRAEEVCSCLGEAIIANHRVDLTIWTSSLGWLRSGAAKDFGVALAQQQMRGACSGPS